MDKRIIKSTQLIKDAYLKLLFKKEPGSIQVKDLCLTAGINRSTFYDRYGFLGGLEIEVIVDAMKSITFVETQIDALPKKVNGIDKEIIRTYIKAFCENKILMRFCMAKDRDKYVDIIAHKQIDLCANSLTSITYYEAYFQCIGALATLIEWVNNPKKHSLEDMVDIVYKHSIAMFSK